MKKQIAVLMAAATAVTTVAPALAHADYEKHSDVASNVVSKVKAALDQKYAEANASGLALETGSLSKDYLNSQNIVLVHVPSNEKNAEYMEKLGYTTFADSAYRQYGFNAKVEVKDNLYITPYSKATKDNDIDTDASNYYLVTNTTNLENVLEKFGDSAKVYIQNKGAYKDNKAVINTEYKHYVNADKKDNGATTMTLIGAVDEIRNYMKQIKALNETSFFTGVTVYTQTNENGVLKSAKEYVVVGENEDTNYTNLLDALKSESTKISKVVVKTLGKGDISSLTLQDNGLVYDFNKLTNDAKNSVQLFETDGNKVLGNNTKDTLKSITSIGYKNNDGNKKVDVLPVYGSCDEYTNLDQTLEAIELKDVYTREGGYSQEGADFVNSLIDARMGKNNFSFNFRGVNYILDGVLNYKDAKITTSGNGYKLSFVVNVKNANDLALGYQLRFEIYGTVQKDLYDVLRDLQGNVNVVAGHFTKLAGANRYETAIAVSQEQFKPETADSVVIVGGYAQMDGLAAAPLASAKNAPILLSDPKTGLSADTLKEIKRACKNLRNRTVYIVGGNNSVPYSVEKQLEKEFGAVVIRTAGADRNATSLAVAGRLFYDGQTNGKVFIVGSQGGADAMGIASVASIAKKSNTEAQLKAQQAVQNLNDQWSDVVSSKTGLEEGIKKTLEGNNNTSGNSSNDSDTNKKSDYLVKDSVNGDVIKDPTQNDKTSDKVVGKLHKNGVSKDDIKKYKEAVLNAEKAVKDAEISSDVVNNYNKVMSAIQKVTSDANDTLRNALRILQNVNSTKYKDATVKDLEQKIDPLSTDGNDAKVDALVTAFGDKLPTLNDLQSKNVIDVIKKKAEAATNTKAAFDALNGLLEDSNGLTTAGKRLVESIVQKDIQNAVNQSITTVKADYKNITGKDANNEFDATQFYAKQEADGLVSKVSTVLKDLDQYTNYVDAAKKLEDAKAELKAAQSLLDNAEKTFNDNVKNANKEIDTFNKFMENLKSVNKEFKYDSKLNGHRVSPIIVTNKNSLDRLTRDFIKYALNNNKIAGINNHKLEAYIIGGENSVSSRVRKDLSVAVDSGNIYRVAGADRYETNAKVIKNFYTNGKNYVDSVTGKLTTPELIRVKGAIFTSGENQYLVDSQTAGFFAASKSAPIVLTNTKLTQDQINLMSEGGVLYGQRSGIYQVGGVVSADVMKEVVSLLGL